MNFILDPSGHELPVRRKAVNEVDAEVVTNENVEDRERWRLMTCCGNSEKCKVKRKEEEQYKTIE